MPKSFVGKAEHKVDAKGRVSLPTSFRRVAQDGDPNCADRKSKCEIILMHGRKPNCLMGYSLEHYDALCAKIAAMPPHTPATEELKAMVFGNAEYVDVDDAGRFGLKDMREIAGITDKCVFRGMGENFEIWVPSALKEQAAAQAATQTGDPFAQLDAAPAAVPAGYPVPPYGYPPYPPQAVPIGVPPQQPPSDQNGEDEE